MKDILQEARQAFKERYGAEPEQQGFRFVEELRGKIFFATEKGALEAAVAAEAMVKKTIHGLTKIMLLAVIVASWYLFTFQSKETLDVGFMVILATAFLIMIGYNTKREQEYADLKKKWDGKVVIYNQEEEEIIT